MTRINPMAGALHLIEQVREKRERQSSDPQNRGHSGENSGDHPGNGAGSENDKKFTDEELNAAVESFKTDEAAQANGLQAAAVGEGPGLRVVLKDSHGAVVRQFSGEEFLRLRQEVSNGSRRRGKILDQKL